MNSQNKSILDDYLIYCKTQKRLSSKTLKAYRIDLTQFFTFFDQTTIYQINATNIESIIAILNQKYKPKTVKRKLASIKSLFHYLEYKDIIKINPFNKLKINFRDSILLPKTIPLYAIKSFLTIIYKEHTSANTSYRRKRTLLDIAIIETLFSTGMRVSELCNLKNSDVDLNNASIRIYGKGSKERLIPIGNNDVINILQTYKSNFHSEILKSSYFFSNVNATPVSDQAIRRMINKYRSLAAMDIHITPHMFRHTFATSLLEADVDIRYIQEMLGHSSITVTEIYTHVALSKQKDILSTKHPRNSFKF